ncbi:MAG TPA: xanthine dehydrogenase family protein molybdopterin-binding subunit [Candidatus Binatia bacterium]|nr:xanthine dehydrogenase family protein molybdopterin-binding subunit [Candidatus Binatia bacterium]
MVALSTKFIGQPLKRLEDPRLLLGQATFLDDLRLADVRHVAFVRSLHAHARFRVDASAATRLTGVFAIVTALDFQGAPEFREVPTVVPHPALRPCGQLPLARDKVRYVGEAMVAVVAESRYAAEDGAAAVRVEYEPLDPVPDAQRATAPGAAVLHDPLNDNLAATFTVQVGDPDGAFRSAEVVTRGRYYVHRHTGMPLETRGVVAHWEGGSGQLTLWSSTQWPHTLRDVLRDVLGLAEHRVRVIAPDVGGGFGVKQEIYPEELLLALLARRLAVPVKWIETRREHLLSTAHAREQWHDIELAARRDGTILGMRAEVLADLGAYARSLGVLCPSITAASLPGPYRFRNYACRVRVALTSKAPAAAYRGAGQPEAVFATERAIDDLARELGLDPADVRRRNLIRRDEFPWDTGTGSAQVPLVYDSGDYERALDTALTLVGYRQRRAEQAAERAKGEHGRLLGVGLASYVLLTGLGPHEGAVLRVDATGRALLITGASPHGQGTATALAQIVADELGLRPDDVTVQHGDTAMIPFGVGTYASRNAVVAGSAALVAARAVRTKARRLAAHLLEAGEADLEFAEGGVRVIGAPDRRRSLAELAAACAPGSPLPDGMEPGLEATRYFLAPRATFASGAHVAVVEVERETGQVTIVDYGVASDAGPLINPRIVEGQIHGGVAQGVGGALYEELAYDDQGQPRMQSLLEYVMPTAGQIPSMRIAHLTTPSPLNPLGVKGVGEAGTVAPPAAIVAAVEDALRPFGARITATPIRAEDLWRLARATM